MPAIDEFRLGICYCARRYHNKLKGQLVILEELADLELANPLELTIREIIINSLDHDDDLTLYRCHAFLDAHYLGEGKYSTFLRLIELIPNRPGCRDSLYYGVTGGSNSNCHFRRNWFDQSPPRASTVHRVIAPLLSRVTNTQLTKWLNRMSPPGWRPPKQRSR